MTVRQADLFERAAKCELASRAVADRTRRAIMQQLRDLWMNLANQSPFMSEIQVREEMAALENIHAAVFGAGENTAAG
jgi:hypothetical protein